MLGIAMIVVLFVLWVALIAWRTDDLLIRVKKLEEKLR